RTLASQSQEHARSVAAARRAAELSNKRYRAGYVNYFEVIDAERQVLASERAALQTERERALATVALVRAIGGAWDAPVARLAASAAARVVADVPASGLASNELADAGGDPSRLPLRE